MRTLTKSSALTVIATLALGLTTAPVADATTTTTSYAVPSVVAAVPSCALSSLPSQASDTLRLIHSGGPFPYSQDGTVFQNREGILPSASNGYYHEYTVKTPGENDRGARRIVTGKNSERYYTDDHYKSFRRIQADGGTDG